MRANREPFLLISTLSFFLFNPHPPQCAHWGTFPQGKAFKPNAKLQFDPLIIVSGANCRMRNILQSRVGWRPLPPAKLQFTLLEL